MTTSRHPINVAVLDDYQGVALSAADWSRVSERASIAVFRDHLTDQDAVAERLAPFDVVCVMRERTHGRICSVRPPSHPCGRNPQI